MTRNRASAKKAGTSWETEIVRALIDAGWPHAERRRLSGTYDRGDIAGVPGIVIEAKNTNRLDLATAVDEALTEGDNANARIAVAWLKRKGRIKAEDGYVVMDGDTFLRFLEAAGFQ
jgi:hypothetical protein